jgi:hypothetical protein
MIYLMTSGFIVVIRRPNSSRKSVCVNEEDKLLDFGSE